MPHVRFIAALFTATRATTFLVAHIADDGAFRLIKLTCAVISWTG